jgi:regulator of protease activity HflC (stomatin/prohibitin superfamily)
MVEFPEIKKVMGVKSGIANYHSISSHETAIAEINGEKIEILSPGEYMFSKIFHTVVVQKYDTRLQSLDISGQEILTKDKISIRLNVSVNFYITDIKLFHSKYSQGYDFIYQKTQFIIRELASANTLDELLESKNEVSEELSKKLISALKNS